MRYPLGVRWAWLLVSLEVDDGGFLVAVQAWVEVILTDAGPMRLQIAARLRRRYERISLN